MRSAPRPRPRRLLSLAALLALPAGAVSGQSPPGYSRFDFSNAYRMLREDAFPNARSSTGNEAGDFLYKGYPKEVLAHDAPVRVSGVRISFKIGQGYKGPLPAQVLLPEVAFYPLVEGKVGGKSFRLPDLSRRHQKTLPLPLVFVARDGVRLFELKLGPKQPDPRLRDPVPLPSRDGKGKLQGWAVALMAIPGEKLGDGKPHFVAVPSFGEIHRLPGPSSFSGAWDARGKRFLPYGTPSAPSNLGELGVELLIDGPVLQVYSNASGGVRKDPKGLETHMGPGAYVNGLATSVLGGWFGLYCQWEGKESDGLVCLPAVTAIGASMPDARLSLGAGTLLWDPARSSGLSFLIGIGMAGPLVRYKAKGLAGRSEDQNGVWVSARQAVPRDPALKDLTLWIQCLLFQPASGKFPGASNLVRVVF
ncbi:MAG: hypothetical protein ACE5F1_08095 [Planctomycetota bacterium]